MHGVILIEKYANYCSLRYNIHNNATIEGGLYEKNTITFVRDRNYAY